MKKGIFYTVLILSLVVGVTALSSYVSPSKVVNTLTTGTTTGSTTVSTPLGNTTTSKTYTIEKVKSSSDSIILFNVPVMGESVDAVIDIISNSSAKTVYLVLDSPGGSVVDGARLLEYMKNSGKNIITVCDNLCASMAFQIFEVGARRLMTEKAILMAHPASGGAQGTIENMDAMIKMFRLYVDRMDADVAKRSNIEYDKFKGLVANNIWAETPEALALGLADGVVHLTAVQTLGKSNTPTNILNILKSQNKWNDEMLKIKGYQIILK